MNEPKVSLSEIRVRPFKGSKKRPLFVKREPLKKLAMRMRGLNRTARALRGALRRTGISQAGVQIDLNNRLKQVQQAKEGIMAYLRRLQAVEARS